MDEDPRTVTTSKMIKILKIHDKLAKNDVNFEVNDGVFDDELDV